MLRLPRRGHQFKNRKTIPLSLLWPQINTTYALGIEPCIMDDFTKVQ